MEIYMESWPSKYVIWRLANSSKIYETFVQTWSITTTSKQGCIRPRPSPSWRPSTRYNGVSDPPRGGVRLQDFGPRGGVDCRVFGFSGAKRPKRRRRRRFRKFWRFFENFTKLKYIKSSEITFQGHFGRTHFCVLTLEKSQIFARTSTIHILASGRSVLC